LESYIKFLSAGYGYDQNGMLALLNVDLTEDGTADCVNEFLSECTEEIDELMNS
jgi:hypothetical protein